ncbi:MAG TPA: M14 family zinc carboxypeptidase, partial [Actinomycetota bacterium]|nr:M14 family zinc carboxypeptidase [Actinomycetota bacterium]
LWRSGSGRTAAALASQQQANGYKVWMPYDGPNGLQAYMEDLAASSSLVELHTLGFTYGYNADGGDPTPRPIYALKVEEDADSDADGDDPAVLYSALQHAREWISGEVNRRLLEWYLKKYEEDVPQIVDLLGSTELWFVLVANPDGYQYTHEPQGDRLWRKNLRDNDSNGEVNSLDGVDPNRNFDAHWGYDEEGSASIPSDQTYRGPSAESEPETQAIVSLYEEPGLAVDFAFHVNYHSFGELLLYSFGWQVQTPSADDPIFTVLSGTDKKPAIQGFNPGVGADLYITNGETTDWAHATQGTLAWTPELSEGPNGDGFIFPDSNGAVENEFKKLLPFSLDVALSAEDPDDPVSHQGFETEPFYLDVADLDPQKAHNPLSDFSFAYSYGHPQPVQILAKRDLNDDGDLDADDDVTVHWSVDGGAPQTAPASEWLGGDRFGEVGDEYYRVVGADVSGFDAGDPVEVWFEGGGHTSESFTFEAVSNTGHPVLILAAEDYSGAANWPAYPLSGAPHFLSYYTAALDARGTPYDIYDVDAMGRVAPDHLGVLSHYDAVLWYTGNDYLTREPGQAPGTGAATLANSEILEVRSYLNEGGKLLYTGRHAGWQYAFAYPYNPVTTPPYCDETLPQKQAIDCLLLSDDFLQYYLGAYLFIEDGGTVGETPAPIQGLGPFTGSSWTLNGGDSADNHYANPVRGTTQSFLTTSSLLPAQSQFMSSAVAEWSTGLGGAYAPHGGSAGYVYSDRGDISYKRLVQEIDVPALPGDTTLEFWISYDTEPNWDFVFVEARTPGGDDYVTLLDGNGHTSNSTALDAANGSCPAGWFELHPHLELYQGADCGGSDFLAEGWHAASGRSAGWEQWSVDLSPWAGQDVEVSISYASDWAVQGVGAFVDDIDAPGTTGDATFDASLDGWTVMDGTTLPLPSDPNPNNWFQTGDVGFQEGAAVTMTPSDADFVTLYFGFGFEGITEETDRFAVMDQAMTHLGV